MILVGAILLAIFVLHGAAAVAVVAVGAAVEIGESIFWIRWSQRRRAKVGAETLVGRTAKALTPEQVQVQGEIWRARSTSGEPLEPGTEVRILALEDLTLIVEPL